jgi:hypothetical protein
MPSAARASRLRPRALVPLLPLPCLLLALTLASALAAVPGVAHARPKAVVAMFPIQPAPPPGTDPEPDAVTVDTDGLPEVLSLLDSHPELALGMLSATQSGYSQEQALLDITQGSRTSRNTYRPRAVPKLRLLPDGEQGLIVDWLAAVARADSAPAPIVPGLLASSVPGGVGYAGIRGTPNLEAIAAADREGVVRGLSLGTRDTVARRTRELLSRHDVVVALLPPSLDGDRQLDELIAARPADELLIAMQAPPPFSGPQLLWTGIAGLTSGAGGSFSSATTHLDGVAANIDLLPTILDHLGLPVPEDDVRGQPILRQGTRDAAALEALDARLSVISGRRMPALQTFLFIWLAVVLLAGIVRDRVGVRFALRLGGLALLWLPFMVLVTAALEPSRQGEQFLIAGGSFLLALGTDLLVPWPRGPALPAIAGLVAYTADLVNHSHLIIRSLLGPSPRSGSRFYGLGNELEIALTILLLIAIAATLRRRERTRAGALACALGGVALAAVMGSGRLGADVGGIFSVAGGVAVATLLMLPGGVTKRALGIAVLTPAIGLAGLAVLDLATAGDGHFTRTVLEGSLSDQLDTFERRYRLAWTILSSGYGPVLLLLCVLAVTYALVHRRRIYGAVELDPVWRACLFGGLGAAVSGSLFNDSGPMLLFIGIVALTFLTAYLRAGPDGPAAGGGEPASEQGARPASQVATFARTQEPAA